MFKKFSSAFFNRCRASSGRYLRFELFLLFQHTTAINQISIDQSGDYVASCSDDGRVSIILKSCEYLVQIRCKNKRSSDILSFVQNETKKLKDDPRFIYYLTVLYDH